MCAVTCKTSTQTSVCKTSTQISVCKTSTSTETSVCKTPLQDIRTEDWETEQLNNKSNYSHACLFIHRSLVSLDAEERCLCLHRPIRYSWMYAAALGRAAPEGCSASLFFFPFHFLLFLVTKTKQGVPTYNSIGTPCFFFETKKRPQNPGICHFSMPTKRSQNGRFWPSNTKRMHVATSSGAQRHLAAAARHASFPMI